QAKPRASTDTSTRRVAAAKVIPNPPDEALLTSEMYTPAMTAPAPAEMSPAHITRRDPHAAVAYSTIRIATLNGSGDSPAAICTSAPTQAAVSAIPGASRPTATAPHWIAPARTVAAMAAASEMPMKVRLPGA